MVVRRGAHATLASFLALGFGVAITLPAGVTVARNGAGGTVSAGASEPGSWTFSIASGGVRAAGTTTPLTASGGTKPSFGLVPHQASGGVSASLGGARAASSKATGGGGGVAGSVNKVLMPPSGIDPDSVRPTWLEAEVTLTVDPSYLAMPYAKEALEGALLAWTSRADQLPKVTLRFTDEVLGKQTTEQNRADHRIFFAPNGDPRAKGALAVTLLTADENKNSILDADILVNGGHLFSDATTIERSRGDCQTYDLQNVITHELGHWFGLNEDYVDTEATMYAYVYPGELKKRSLEDADVTAVQLAYWQADNPSENTSGCNLIRPQMAGSQAWIWGLLGWALCLRRVNRQSKPHLLPPSGRLHH